MKPTEVLPKIIRLGEASQEYWDGELPKHHPNYPLIDDSSETSPRRPPMDDEIESILSKLPEDQLYAVASLMYLGRGDFGSDRFSETCHEVRGKFPSTSVAIRHIMAKPLAEYLADAMESAENNHINI